MSLPSPRHARLAPPGWVSLRAAVACFALGAVLALPPRASAQAGAAGAGVPSPAAAPGARPRGAAAGRTRYLLLRVHPGPAQVRLLQLRGQRESVEKWADTSDEVLELAAGDRSWGRAEEAGGTYLFELVVPGFALSKDVALPEGCSLLDRGTSAALLAIEADSLAISSRAAEQQPVELQLSATLGPLSWPWWWVATHQGAASAGLAILAGGCVLLWRRRRGQRSDGSDLGLEPGGAVRARPEDLVGGYRLIEELGKGGMSTVYRAVRQSGPKGAPRVEVALKWMRDALPQEGDLARRFTREVRLGQSLSHSNIVRVLDSGSHQQRVFLVMDLIEGDSLEDLLEEGGMPIAEVCRVVKQVAAALDYAHGQGVVHRDLKPGNVMRTREGEYLLADFGLARSHDFSKLTRTGTAVGTPAYMPPEQILGSAVGASADQYSFGTMVYEMLCGRLPFEANNLSSLLMKHLNEEPAPPSTLRPDLPPAADAVITRMLAKQPDKRYPSVAEAARDLLQALEAPGEPAA